MRRRLILYLAAAVLGVVLVAAYRWGGLTDGLAAALAGFFAGGLIFIGLPFAHGVRLRALKNRSVMASHEAAVRADYKDNGIAATDYDLPVVTHRLHETVLMTKRPSRLSAGGTHALSASLLESSKKSVEIRAGGNGHEIEPTSELVPSSAHE